MSVNLASIKSGNNTIPGPKAPLRAAGLTAHERCQSSTSAPILDTIAKNASTASQCDISSSVDYSRVIRRFALQSAARELLPRQKVAVCLRRPVPGRSVDVLYAPASRSSHYSGLQVCASVWHCPVCAAKISERRRVELSEGLKRWYVGEGVRRVIMVTFTLQHSLGDALETVLGSLKKARRLLMAGRAAQSFASDFGITGSVRALEVTYGQHGWHPHLHVLYFFNREVPIIPFQERLKSRWSAAVASVGRYVSHQAIDVRFTDADIAEYVAKYGKEPKWTAAHEVAKAPAKSARAGGRTPLQLLSEYLDGDKDAGLLWLQYAVNFHGERQLFFSHGLRDLLGLTDEKTDEEIASEQSEIAIILASLSVGAWRVVLGNDARAELLEVAALGDIEQVNSFLRSLGVKGA